MGTTRTAPPCGCWAWGRWLAVLLALWIVLPVRAQGSAPPLFAPGARSGSVTLELRPTEAVAAGQSRLVTFGLPLPRGALLPSELGQVRVSLGGQEVPAWVDMLTPWRHLSDPAQDGTSVRVARIQFEHQFQAGYPAAVPVTVSWNQGARTLSRPARLDARTAWHQVTDGRTASGGSTFGAGHRVFEPDVYAVLPKSWLAAAGMKNPVRSFGDTVRETRREPASMQASYPGFEEADHAQVNFFYTIINDDEPNTAISVSNNNPFYDPAEYEPWLYDRAMGMYVGYLRGGHFRMLREAVRNADYYRQQLWTPADCGNGACVGSFKLKNTNPANSWHDQKYSYNESLLFTHWLTGDDLPLAPIEHVTRQYTDAAAVNDVFWTERHMGLKLLAEVVAWEHTGKTEYRDRLRATLQAFRQGQTSPYGGLVDGGIWHSIGGHEGDPSTEPITSPWMSALIVDAALRAVVMGEASHAVPLVEGLAHHVCGRGSYMTTQGLTSQSGGVAVRMPHYLATRDGNGWASEVDPWSNFEHAHEVGTMAAWGAYFRARAQDTSGASALTACAQQFYTTFSHGITYWTRPGTANYDAYRVNPPRKYTWWFKNASGFGWAMAAVGATGPAPVTVQLTSPAHGSQYQAPATITLSATVSQAVARVEFWADGVKLGEDASAPYAFTVTGVPAGTYHAEARAMQSDGTVVTSPAATVQVITAAPPPPNPVVTLTSPATGSAITLGQALSLAAGVSGSTSVSRVDWRVGGTVVASDNQAPYSASWTPSSAGTLSMTARATLADGRTFDSPAALVTVTAAPPSPSTVTLTSPTSGSSGVVGRPIAFTATVSGATAVTKIDWLVGGAVVVSDVQAPYASSWTPTSAGTFNIRARALLSDGRTVESTTASIVVIAPPPAGTVVQLRQGLDGYTGMRDLSVSNQYVQYNAGRGVVSNDARAGAYRITGSGAYEVRSFLRFGGLEAHAGRRVAKAELVLHFAWGASGYMLGGRYLAQAWDPAAANFGWTFRTATQRWSAVGSGGADWVAGRSFSLSGFTARAADRRVVALDPAVVQGWIDQPASNHGMVLLATADNQVSWLRTSEDPTGSYRPTLVLTFE